MLADPDYEWPINREHGVHTAFGVPVFRGAEVVGVIGAARMAVNPFTDAEVALVRAFADQASIAMENVRLFNETKDALDRQTATGDVLRIISQSAFELEPVFKAIVESAKRLCGADVSALFLLRDGLYRIATHTGGDEYRKYWEEHPIAPGRETVVGRAALE